MVLGNDIIIIIIIKDFKRITHPTIVDRLEEWFLYF